MVSRPFRAAAVALAAVGLSSCAMLPKFAKWVDFRPTRHVQAAAPAAPVSRADALYGQAVAALKVRDYGLALDILQVANQARPNDARVLNAIGVAYDKLGRFDLSGRYYDAAATADPGSLIVAANQRYSLALRTQNLDLRQFAMNTAPPLEVASPVAPAPAPSHQLRALIAQPMVNATPIRLASGSLLIAQALRIDDASGRPGSGEAIRADLAKAGWSVGRRPPPPAPTQAQTTVRHPARHAAVARALARALPFPVTQSVCETCTGLELRVGQDAPAAAEAKS